MPIPMVPPHPTIPGRSDHYDNLFLRGNIKHFIELVLSEKKQGALLKTCIKLYISLSHSLIHDKETQWSLFAIRTNHTLTTRKTICGLSRNARKSQTDRKQHLSSIEENHQRYTENKPAEKPRRNRAHARTTHY